jgi:hypothetical protein
MMSETLLKGLVFWDLTILARWKLTEVSEEYIALIFSNLCKKPTWSGQQACSVFCLLRAGFLLDLLLDPEDGESMFLRNVSWL